MGVSSLVIIVFIAASMGLSWISGDKEQERLYDRVAKRGVETQDAERELGDKNRQFERQTKELQQIKSKLRVELRAKKKIERKLAYEKRQRRLADERWEKAGGSKKTEKSTSRPASSPVSLNEADKRLAQSIAERNTIEKVSAGKESRVKLEIAELEKKLRAVEEHSKRLEAEMQVRVEKETKKRSEAAWDQAKLAKVKAEQAAAESLQLKSRLNKVKKAKEAVDLALSEQEDALIRAEERLAKERMEREKLEEKLNNANNALDTSKAEGIGAIEEASTALKAAEKAVSIARIPEEVMSSAKAISRLDTVRVEVQKGLNVKSQEISFLKSRIKEIESEKEIISNEALGNSNRLIALKQQLEMVKLKESDLRDTLKEQKEKFAAELASALGEQKLSLKKIYDAKLVKLESRFADAGIATVEADQMVGAETVRLRARTLELEEQNRNLNKMLRESKIALAEASAEREIAKELIAKNVALESRLKEAGLANLQGKAADFVAQKLIERNAGLEQQLQVARLGLAKSEAARARAAELAAENSTLTSKLKNAEVSLAAYEGSSDVVKQITSRNAELEGKIVEAEAALAQADAARYMVEELNSKNIELNEMLARERAAGSDGSEIEAKLRNINSALELKLKEERGVRGGIEAKLVEAIDAKSAGEIAIEDLVKLRGSAEESLRIEIEAKKALEAVLVKTESKLNLSEQSVAQAVKSKRDAEALLLKLRTSRPSDGPVMAKRGNVEVAAALNIANLNRKELELKLQSQTEAGRIVEAKLRMFEETVGKQRETIKSLEQAVAEAEARLEGKVRAIDEIKAEINSVAAMAKSVSTEAGSDITLAALQGEFTTLKSKIKRRLKSGELKAGDLAKIVKTDGLFDIHIVGKGETLWSISSKKENYANPYMWPLIYRYNVSNIKQMSRLLPGQVLIIFKGVPKAEAGDAIKKAKYLGDWKKWSAKQQKSWISGETHH